MAANKNNLLVFCSSWFLLFIIYLPATQAGFVADYTGWLQNLQNDSFSDYINRKHHSSKSLYQFTQFSTYVFYLLFGTTAWFWHLLHITLHACNCLLLYKFITTLFQDAGIKSLLPVLLTIILYCVNPHITEVIVWEPSYHYLTGMLFILSILVLLQKFIRQQKAVFAIIAAIIYLLSSFSLEVFYLTPLFVIVLTLYYYFILNTDKNILKQGAQYFLFPQIVVLALYFIMMRVSYNEAIAHIGATPFQQSVFDYLVKAPKYLFHVLLFGRFWSYELKTQAYTICISTQFLIIFYTLLSALLLFITIRFKQIGSKSKVAALLFVCTLIALSILTPLWFEDIMLSTCDRYTYIFIPFLYSMFMLGLYSILNRKLFIAISGLYIICNLYFSQVLIQYWSKSSSFISHLLSTFPETDGKIKVFLNLPQSLNGVAMFYIGEPSEAKLMNQLFCKEKTTDTCFDVAAYNMITTNAGAWVKVEDDSSATVHLTEPWTWWWYGYRGLSNYENDYYRISMNDKDYRITLKKASDKYTLIFVADKQWKKVDWNRKNIAQR